MSKLEDLVFSIPRSILFFAPPKEEKDFPVPGQVVNDKQAKAEQPDHRPRHRRGQAIRLPKEIAIDTKALPTIPDAEGISDLQSPTSSPRPS